MKFEKKPFRFLLVLLIPITIISACDQIAGEGPDPDSTGLLVKTIPPATLTAISEAAEKAETPAPDPLGVPLSDLNGIELDFWYIWDLDQPGIGMNAIVDRFNLENEWGIIISAIDQGLVIDPLTSIETAFDEGLVPHILISDASAISGWYRDDLIVDLFPYLEDPAAAFTPQQLKSFYEGIWEGYTVDQAHLPGIPFSQTIQVIYYNQSWAKELGYPSPPDSLQNLTQQACSAAEDHETGPGSAFQGTGILLDPDPSNIWSSLTAYSAAIIDPEKGYDLSSPEMISVAEDWRTPVLEGCGTMLYAYPDPMASELVFDNFNRREAIMVMGSSRLINHVHPGPNSTGRADDWLMLPFLGPDGEKAVSAEIQAGVIFETSPAEELASWLFLQYLVSPEVQAEWAQYSGDYPINKSSLRFLRDYRDENPNWSQGLNLLKYAIPEPLDPSWNTVQLALGDAFEEILLDTTVELEEQLQMLDQITAELWEYSQ